MRGCDAVVHLAARIGMHMIVESPLVTLEVNARGTEVVLKRQRARVRRRSSPRRPKSTGIAELSLTRGRPDQHRLSHDRALELCVREDL